MVNIAICDDDATPLGYTASLVRRELSSYALELDSFQNAQTLLNCVETEGYRPDIAILDIEMGKLSGIDVAKAINTALPACRIIFLSSHADYITASYEAEHVWYVLKSQADTYIGQALRKAMAALPAADASVLGIAAKSGGSSFFVPLGRILYIDRENRRTRIVCEDGIHRVSGTPASLITGPLQEQFVRCHQGYWVNLGKIQALDRDEFVLSDGTRLPISRTCRAEARERFFHRLRERMADT